MHRFWIERLDRRAIVDGPISLAGLSSDEVMVQFSAPWFQHEDKRWSGAASVVGANQGWLRLAWAEAGSDFDEDPPGARVHGHTVSDRDAHASASDGGSSATADAAEDAANVDGNGAHAISFATSSFEEPSGYALGATASGQSGNFVNGQTYAGSYNANSTVQLLGGNGEAVSVAGSNGAAHVITHASRGFPKGAATRSAGTNGEILAEKAGVGSLSTTIEADDEWFRSTGYVFGNGGTSTTAFSGGTDIVLGTYAGGFGSVDAGEAWWSSTGSAHEATALSGSNWSTGSGRSISGSANSATAVAVGRGESSGHVVVASAGTFVSSVNDPSATTGSGSSSAIRSEQIVAIDGAGSGFRAAFDVEASINYSSTLPNEPGLGYASGRFTTIYENPVLGIESSGAYSA